MNPFDYSLCRDTVTLYRRSGNTVTRQVVEHCHLHTRQVLHTDAAGKSMEKTFLLIIPGQADLAPEDRVYRGIGPETVQWESFTPVRIPALYEISYVMPCYWNGAICHMQAGHKEGL